MEKNGDLSDFKHGMVVSARRAGLSISETRHLLGISHITVFRPGVSKELIWVQVFIPKK